ncbi:MAG: hypothetical protein EA398_17350 [Deltaproteobacteria bacterium]|nr:MAG: hypothetical protein EA398_17350 [Deltaproteobacteria bacterium]
MALPRIAHLLCIAGLALVLATACRAQPAEPEPPQEDEPEQEAAPEEEDDSDDDTDEPDTRPEEAAGAELEGTAESDADLSPPPLPTLSAPRELRLDHQRLDLSLTPRTSPATGGLRSSPDGSLQLQRRPTTLRLDSGASSLEPSTSP